MFIVQKSYLAIFFKYSFLFSIFAMLMALYYQLHMGANPCVICIHIRAIVVLIGLVSFISFFITSRLYLNFILFIPYSIMSVIGIIKSYTGYKVEQGDIFSGCTMDPGFPAYLRMDNWFPYIFKPSGLCGEKLVMFGDVTMMMLSLFMLSIMLAVSVVLIILDIAYIVRIKKHRL